MNEWEYESWIEDEDVYDDASGAEEWEDDEIDDDWGNDEDIWTDVYDEYLGEDWG